MVHSDHQPEGEEDESSSEEEGAGGEKENEAIGIDADADDEDEDEDNASEEEMSPSNNNGGSGVGCAPRGKGSASSSFNPGADMRVESEIYNRMKSGKSPEELKRWGTKLKAAALETSLLLHHKTAKESQCVKEADAAQKELQSYVGVFVLSLQGIFLTLFFKSHQLYVKYGLSVNGFIVGTNALHSKVNSTPRFFGPTPQFTTFLQDLLWAPAHMRQYIVAFV